MISIVYWSQTGNTQAMAEAISEGVTDALVERPLHSLAHMAGVTVSGCVTG